MYAMTRNGIPEEKKRVAKSCLQPTHGIARERGAKGGDLVLPSSPVAMPLK
jgi:hypothetical protein